MQTLVETPALEHAAGELVDDQDLTVADDVVLVTLEQLFDLERIVQVAHQRRVGRLVQVVDAQLVLDELDALLVHTDGALTDVDLVVHVLLEQRRDAGELGVPLARRVGGTGDDQRRPGLVDEDRVDLVDDGKRMPALHQVVQRVRHVVAEIVETELVVGSVGDVGVVGLAALIRRHPGQDDGRLEPEEAVHAAHPLGVTFGEVVVDGHHVHAVAGQRIEIGGQHTGEGLALTGLHLGDVAEMQGGAAHDLNVEVFLREHPPGGLPGDRERLRQEIIERLATGVALLELVGFGPQLLVGQRLGLVVERLHMRSDGIQAFDHPAFADAQQLVEHWFYPRSN